MTTRNLFPQPAVSVVVFITFVFAQNTLSAGSIALGGLLALTLPRFTARFWPDYPDKVRYGALLRLFAIVLYDILVANVRVAVLVLGPRAWLKPGFITVPLAVQSSPAISLLASIISLTPGTVSSNLSGDRRTLLVHGISIADPTAAVAKIKARYEARVLEVFEC